MKSKQKLLLCFDQRKLDELDPSEITDEDRGLYSLILLQPEHKEFPEQYPKTDHCSQDEFARVLELVRTESLSCFYGACSRPRCRGGSGQSNTCRILRESPLAQRGTVIL